MAENKETQTDEEKEKAIEKILGEPVFISFTDETNHIRRNLLVFVFIALVYKLSKAEIDKISPFGIDLMNIDQNVLNIGFFCIVLYHSIHFLWQSFDALQEWRIRLTGTFNIEPKAADISPQRYNINMIRQFSLMGWWQQQKELVEEYQMGLFDLLKQGLNLKTNDINEKHLIDSKPYGEKFESIQENINKMRDVLHSEPIAYSLKRFDRWYRMFSYSQLARFILLEWGLPLALSAWALYLLAPAFWGN